MALPQRGWSGLEEHVTGHICRFLTVPFYFILGIAPSLRQRTDFDDGVTYEKRQVRNRKVKLRELITQTRRDISKEEALLPQRDLATRYVSKFVLFFTRCGS